MNFNATLIKTNSALVPASEDLCENMVYAPKKLLKMSIILQHIGTTLKMTMTQRIGAATLKEHRLIIIP